MRLAGEASDKIETELNKDGKPQAWLFGAVAFAAIKINV
jgi:hypothetical protein